MATVGNMEPFDEGVEDWPTYLERLEQFFVVNNVKDEKRKSHLITFLGAKTYRLLKSLTAPTKPSDKTYEELTEILEGHLAPKPIVVAERFKFYRRDQGSSESIAQYVVALKELARTCDYGAVLDDMLRDRLICGVNSEPIRNKLLFERDLTFKKALDLSLSIESARAASTELAQSQKNSTVNAVQSGKGQSRQWTKSQNFSKCWRCTGSHNPDSCCFKNESCHSCGHRGHISRCCPQHKTQKFKPRGYGNQTQSPNKSGSPNKSSFPGGAHGKSKGRGYTKPKKTHNIYGPEHSPSVMAEDVYVSDAENESDHDFIWALKHIGQERHSFKVDAQLDGKTIPLELDTGSEASIMPANMYEEHFNHFELKPTETQFEGYFGSVKQARGLIEVPVSYEGQSKILPMYVLDSSGPALFGRSWMKSIKLNWQQVLGSYVTVNNLVKDKTCDTR